MNPNSFHLFSTKYVTKMTALRHLPCFQYVDRAKKGSAKALFRRDQTKVRPEAMRGPEADSQMTELGSSMGMREWLVALAGVEPATCGLGNRRSIHLSYRATWCFPTLI